MWNSFRTDSHQANSPAPVDAIRPQTPGNALLPLLLLRCLMDRVNQPFLQHMWYWCFVAIMA